MPLLTPLPDQIVANVLQLLHATRTLQHDKAATLWLNQQLKSACRHIEFFVRPLVSVKAARTWIEVGGQHCLRDRRYKARSHWPQGQHLFFEHAVPAADIKDALIELGDSANMNSVREELQRAEIVWIKTDENDKLPHRGKRRNWRAVYKQCGIKLHEEDACPCLCEARLQ